MACSCPILPVSALCWNQGAHAPAPMSSCYCQPHPPSPYLLTLLQILLCDSLVMSLHVVSVWLPAFLPKANICVSLVSFSLVSLTFLNIKGPQSASVEHNWISMV